MSKEDAPSVLRNTFKGVSRRAPGDHARRALALGPVAIAMAVVAVAGCGSSKPAYCSDRSNLENSIKGLTSAATSGGLSGLASQVSTIQSDATAVVGSAGSDFPSQTSAVKSSVNTLSGAVKALPSSPSTAQLATIAADAASVVSAVKGFTNATSSNCS